MVVCMNLSPSHWNTFDRAEGQIYFLLVVQPASKRLTMSCLICRLTNRTCIRNYGWRCLQVSERAQKHVEELIAVTKAGAEAAAVFVVQRGDCEHFGPSWEKDRRYAQLLQQVNPSPQSIPQPFSLAFWHKVRQLSTLRCTYACC